MYAATVRRGRQVKVLSYDVLTSREELAGWLAQSVQDLGGSVAPGVQSLMTFDRVGDYQSERFMTVSEAAKRLNDRPVDSADAPSGTVFTVVF